MHGRHACISATNKQASAKCHIRRARAAVCKHSRLCCNKSLVCGAQISIGRQLKQIVDVESSVRIGFLAHVRLRRLMMQCRFGSVLCLFSNLYRHLALSASKQNDE